MTEDARRHLNGIANVFFGAALIAATIIGIIALFQSHLNWWQIGLSCCGIVFLWGLIVYSVAKCPEFRGP